MKGIIELLENCCYYYSAGYDITPILEFQNYIENYIYSDNCEDGKFEDNLDKIQNQLISCGFKKIQFLNIDSRYLGMTEKYYYGYYDLSGKMITSEIKGNITIYEKEGKSLTLLYLELDNTATWINLFLRKNIKPTAICNIDFLGGVDFGTIGLPNSFKPKYWLGHCHEENYIKAKKIKHFNNEGIYDLFEYLPKRIDEIIKKDELIFVEGDEFFMGSQNESPNGLNYSKFAKKNESPVHKVKLDNFLITKFPITNYQWVSIMGYESLGYSQLKFDMPIVNVSWDDIQIFIKKLNSISKKNFRLPSEEEWEFAAKGGKFSKNYEYSGSDDIFEISFGFRRPEERFVNKYFIYSHYDWLFNGNIVGSKKSNELGIYDMSGNVWEWCDNYFYSYENFQKKTTDDEVIIQKKVVRGGCVHSPEFRYRPTFRGTAKQNSRNIDCGFRLVCNE